MIWGLWHAAVIATGNNFPGHPAPGVVLTTAYRVLLAYVLGQAVLKTGDVLLAAFVHQLNTGFGGCLTTFWYKPDDVAFSLFAGGLYGLPLLLLVVLLILRDPVWRWEDQYAEETTESGSSTCGCVLQGAGQEVQATSSLGCTSRWRTAISKCDVCSTSNPTFDRCEDSRAVI